MHTYPRLHPRLRHLRRRNPLPRRLRRNPPPLLNQPMSFGVLQVSLRRVRFETRLLQRPEELRGQFRRRWPEMSNHHEQTTHDRVREQKSAEKRCKVTIFRTSRDLNACALPNVPDHGKYVIRSAKRGSMYFVSDGSVVSYVCDGNYALTPNVPHYNCVKGRWSPSEFPRCVRKYMSITTEEKTLNLANFRTESPLVLVYFLTNVFANKRSADFDRSCFSPVMSRAVT